MSENHRDDFEIATAAEQSAEDDEAQTGNMLAEADKSEDAAESQAMHLVDDEDEGDLAGLLEALDAAIDPEADALVDDALEVDSLDEADAALAAAEDEAEIEAAEAALEEPDVTPYDGPELGDDEASDADPYESFRVELRGKPLDIFCVTNAFRSTEDASIYSAVLIMIRAEHPPLTRLSCVHEEMGQAMGLPNDSPDARPSIFNGGLEFALLTEHDEILLRMLYDPRLRPGMTAAEVRPLLPAIARDAIAAERADGARVALAEN